MNELHLTIKDLETIWSNLEQDWENSKDNWASFERQTFDHNIFQDIGEITDRYLKGVNELKIQIDRIISMIEE